jgi:hypothetical protein
MPSARRLMWRFYDMRIDYKQGGMNDLNRRICTRIFWAAEPFDTRQGFHTHGLIKVHEAVSFKSLSEYFQIACGNKDLDKTKWHRVQLRKYTPQKNASYYCGKYITKHLSDYDLWEKDAYIEHGLKGSLFEQGGLYTDC